MRGHNARPLPGQNGKNARHTVCRAFLRRALYSVFSAKYESRQRAFPVSVRKIWE